MYYYIKHHIMYMTKIGKENDMNYELNNTDKINQITHVKKGGVDVNMWQHYQKFDIFYHCNKRK